MKARSVLAPAILAALLVFGGMWAMDNTLVGQSVKCRVFNDLGACLIVALSQPAAPPTNGGDTYVGDAYVPPPTDSPEERAARLATDQQHRLDAAVTSASSTVGSAIDDVRANADALTSSASDMAGAVRNVSNSANTSMREAYAELKTKTQVRPMDDYAQSDVCYALSDVDYARSDVDYQVDGSDYAKDPYASALSDRVGYMSSLLAAVTQLEAAVAADNGSVIPQYAAADGKGALSSAESAAKAAATKAAKATSDVKALVKTANSWVTKSRKLAAMVASC